MGGSEVTPTGFAEIQLCGYCKNPRRMIAALAKCGFPSNHAQVKRPEPEHDCEPPRWRERRRLGIEEGSEWTCPCGQAWRWRYFGYSDMRAWEPV